MDKIWKPYEALHRTMSANKSSRTGLRENKHVPQQDMGLETGGGKS
jgi:hypothetical protein